MVIKAEAISRLRLVLREYGESTSSVIEANRFFGEEMALAYLTAVLNFQKRDDIDIDLERWPILRELFYPLDSSQNSQTEHDFLGMP